MASGPVQPVTRCVVWHPRGAALPRVLTAALDSRSLAWTAWHSPTLAIADLCRPARPVNKPAGAPTILLLVEPENLPGLGHGLDVLARCRPATPVWVYDARSQSRLRAASIDEALREFCTDTDAPAHGDPPFESAPAGQAPAGYAPPELSPAAVGPRSTTTGTPEIEGSAPAPPRLRLVGEPGANPAQASGRMEPEDHRPPGSLLSEEEIRMLMPTDEPDARRH